jgi:probable blue pigment (indigoidine) exporter
MSRRLLDILPSALGPLIWGSTYLITTTLLIPGRPLLAGTLRALPVGLLLVLVYRQIPKGVWWGRTILLGWLNIGLFFALLFVAAYRLPGGVAATVGAVQPLLAALMAWPLLGQRPSAATLMAAAAGIGGVAMVVLGPAARLDLVGVLASLGATTAMALGTVLTKKWPRPVPVLLFTAWQLVAGGALLAVLTLAIEGLPASMTLSNLAGYGYLALVGAGLAYTLWFRGVERLGMAASFLVLLSPVAALVLDILVLHRSLSVVQTLGALLVLVSVGAGQLSAPATPAAAHATR